MLVGTLFLAIMIGVIPGAIAANKGHSFVGWWFFGAMLFIVALPASLIVKPIPKAIEAKALASGDSKKCPACAEIVKAEARICRYCQHSFDATPATA